MQRALPIESSGMNALKTNWLAAIALTLAACGGGAGGDGDAESASPALPDTPPAPSSSPTPAAEAFADVTAASNMRWIVDFTTPFGGAELTQQVALVTFGGAASGDCDADGDIDLFVTYGDGGPNRLYINQLNQGSGSPLQFIDRAQSAGVAETRVDGAGNDRHSGPSFADMDGDGDLDLFIGGLFGDPNRLYANRGDCVFDDVTLGSGIDELFAEQTISAAFGDYDLDGDLDLFMTHWASTYESSNNSSAEHLFRNISDGDGIRFEDVSVISGVADKLIATKGRGSGESVTDFTFTPSFARINDDVWPDLAIAADFGTAQLLINNAVTPVSFRDATNDALRFVENAMGTALGDYDFDGDLDWFISNIFGDGYGFIDDPTGNRLLRNPGGDFSEEQFADVSESAGIAVGGWGWASCFVDIDNDGDLDIYHSNGFGTLERSLLFVADGADGYEDRAEDYGLDAFTDARGAVCADFDNDGDVDILELTNDDENSAVLWANHNAAAGNNFLRIRLVGRAPNTEAAGARIFVTLGDRTQMREIIIGSNYTSQNPTVQIVGLGTATAVDELRVEWPARIVEEGGSPVRVADTIVAPSALSSIIGIAQRTLVVCHPGVAPRPADCAASVN